MTAKRSIVIVGATSAIAENCARLWVRDEAADLTLVGRDMRRLERVAADLRARSPESEIRAVEGEFSDAAGIGKTVDAIVSGRHIDIVLIAHGSLPDQASCQEDIGYCHQAIEINGVSPVLYAEAFVRHMAGNGHGTIALIGSVAGDRGRKSNYVYGAAKGLVTRYAQGLQHRLAGTGVRVVLVKPGPTDTPMTAHLKREGASLARAEDVAERIVYAVAKGRALVYAPPKWSLIMWVIRHLPRAVFNRMDI